MTNEIQFDENDKGLNQWLYNTLTEIDKAIDKATKSCCQQEIDIFKDCEYYITILLAGYAWVSLKPTHLMFIGAIYLFTRAYNKGCLAELGKRELMAELAEIRQNMVTKQQADEQEQRADERHKEAEQRADERHNSQQALLTTLLDKGNPFDDERWYVDIKTIAKALHSEADRAENTFATRVGEMLKDVKPRYLKSKSAGKPAGYYHVPLVKTMLKRSFNIEETVAYDELIKSGRCVKDDELE